MRQAFLALALAGALAAGQPAFLDQLWSLLTSVWSASTADEGCGADPSGRCNPTPLPTAGCGADPDGGPCGS